MYALWDLYALLLFIAGTTEGSIVFTTQVAPTANVLTQLTHCSLSGHETAL